ncbi:S9 family peptidase [bacterium]|nr:S9 family peptidase [bacterium]
MNKTIIIFLFFICTISIFFMTQTNYIPLEILFGNPEKTQVKTSPNGQFISFLKSDTQNILNVWIQKKGSTQEIQITHDTQRSIRRYLWSFDNQHILYFQDTLGDENFKLYKTNIFTQQTTCLTPFDKVRCGIAYYDYKHRDTLVITLNKDNAQLHDIYTLNIKTNELTLIHKNDGTEDSWCIDHTLQVRGRKITTKTGFEIQYKKADGSWITLSKISYAEPQEADCIGFNHDNSILYYQANNDQDTMQLYAYHVKNNVHEHIIGHPHFDINTVYMNPVTHTPTAVTYEHGRTQWLYINKRFEDHLKTIALDYTNGPITSDDFKSHINVLYTIHRGDPHIISTTEDNTQWIVAYTDDQGPLAYYNYDTTTKSGTFLAYNNETLKSYTLAPMQAIEIPARDGFTLYSYITYPKNTSNKKMPLVLNVHGGPWVQDTWGYDPEAQWFANRGWACLQVNYRSSTGYGKTFLQAGQKQWSKNMHDDLIDAVNWAINQGNIDPKKIAIYGGSYGGYATLVGLTFTPDTFVCGVDIVGIVNLVTWLETIPPYWEHARNYLYENVGNLETEKEFLQECSPLFKANKIKKPLLIAQGAHDPRVKKTESDQMVEALKKNNIPHQYMVFEDEGHGFSNHKNRLTFYKAAETFLKTYLG